MKNSAKESLPLRGVFPVFQTPFHEDESIDFVTLQKEVDWLYDHGADGIVMAMVSEILRLSSEERESLAAHACRYGRDRGHVIISVGAESSHTAERYARHAEKMGASALMAIPPTTVSLSDDEVFRYYERIICATRLPLIVQDASGYVGKPLSISMQAQFLELFGERVLFKPEANPIGPRLTALHEASHGKARVFEGTGGIALVDSHRRGVVGTMPGAELIDSIIALWKALEEKDENRIYHLSQPICSFVAMQTSLDAFLAIEKYILVKRGVFKNTKVRSPVGYHLDRETCREVDRLFDRVMGAIGKKTG